MGSDQTAEMDERSLRIVEVALELAERGGFAAVRMRDIAHEADVALGTLYKRFHSKEDILVVALEHELVLAEQMLGQAPVPGDTPLERLRSFFSLVTRYLCAKPRLARAVLRAVASGDPELAEKVTRFHDRMARLIVLALRGGGEPPVDEDTERRLTDVLQRIWFAALVGWMGGLHDEDAVVEQIGVGARWLLAGVDALER